MTNNSSQDAFSNLEELLQNSGSFKEKLSEVDAEALVFASKEENLPQLTQILFKNLQKTDPKHANQDSANAAAVEMRNVAALRLKELAGLK